MLAIKSIWSTAWLTPSHLSWDSFVHRANLKARGSFTHCWDPTFTKCKNKRDPFNMIIFISWLALLKLQFCSLPEHCPGTAHPLTEPCPLDGSFTSWIRIQDLRDSQKILIPLSVLLFLSLCCLTSKLRYFILLLNCFISKQLLLSGAQILSWSQTPLQFCL